jgi:hypothetical protein
MRKSLSLSLFPAFVVAAIVGLASPAMAANPHSTDSPTGQPSQSCQDFSATTRPGQSAASPGSPFNEPGINSDAGGTGGANYSETSQYDVACFQVAQP